MKYFIAALIAIPIGLSGCFQVEGKPLFESFIVRNTPIDGTSMSCPNGVQAKITDKNDIEVTSPVVLPSPSGANDWGLDPKKTSIVLWPEYTVEIWCFSGQETGYFKAKPKTTYGSPYYGRILGSSLNPTISVSRGTILEQRQPLPYIQL